MEWVWIYSTITENKTCSMRQNIKVEKYGFYIYTMGHFIASN